MNNFVKKINIGNVEIKNNIFLAPMAGITDLPFRVLCRSYGCGLTYTEMASSKAIVYNDKKTNKLFEIDELEQPIAIQIFGHEPDIMCDSIKKIEENEINGIYGYNKISIIDINMGCPVPKLVKNGDGSALLKQPKLVEQIVKSVVSATSKPITVKIRKGWDHNSVNALEIARICEENGAKAITVHGRTREDMYSGKADWDIIRKVKQAVNITVIGNGDIIDYNSAVDMFEKTKCDAIMVGRGSLGRPWIFDEIINNRQIDDNEKLKTILVHIENARHYLGEEIAVKEMRKHIAWYLKGMKDSAAYRNEINTTNNIDMMIALVKQCFYESK